MTDNTGTTPLPVSSAGSPVRVWFDVESVAQQAQQPQTQQIANFEAKANEDCINGSTVAVNQHFVVYTVKNGLIRVLHRHSTLRTLLRAHQDQCVTDIRFFQDGDVLATVGNDGEKSTVVIWRIFERPPEVTAEKLMEFSSVNSNISRVLWHPFNPNQFLMVHTNAEGCAMASLVETTKIQTHPHENHVACDFYSDYVVMQNVVTVQSPGADLLDLAWSPRDSRHLLTTFSSGEIILWDLKKLTPRGDATLAPAQVESLVQSEAVTRCFFLPHDDEARKGNEGRNISPLTTCFATASHQNSVITLWSPFFDHAGAAKPSQIQVLTVERPSPSYNLHVVYGITPPDASPMSSFLVMADRHAGNILAFHLSAQWENVEQDAAKKRTFLLGSDYVVPFKTRYPVFSWSVQCAPSTDITEEELVDQGGLIFDTKLFAYQSKLVQCLTLTSYMCLPPTLSWVDPTPGVRVERMFSVQSAHVSEIDDDEEIDADAIQFDEDYDYNEEEEGGDEDAAANGPSQATIVDKNLSENPFANWLGAIAAKSADDTTTPLPLPPAAAGVTMPPISTPVPPPAPASGSKGAYAVPVVTAPPASALPAPDGEPLAFLSPSDFVGNESPDKKPTDASASKKPNSNDAKKNKAAKKKDKKNAQQQNNDGAGLTILKRDNTPNTSTPRAAKSPTPASSAKAAPVPANVADEIRKVVKEEMMNTVVPAIKSSIKESLNASVVRPLQTSIDDLAKKGVSVDHEMVSASLATSVDPPLQAAFANSMKTVFIPTLESVTGQILEKLSDNLAHSTAETNGTTSKEIAAMSAQLSTMTALVAELTREVKALRDSSGTQMAAAPTVPPPQTVPAVNSMESMKVEIRRLLMEKNFESAFTKAVSASTAELAVFCCTHADLNEVLGMDQPQLSQPIILCLIQQLGTVIAMTRSSLQVELDWLQDLALSLDSNDKKIQQHVPRVLQQLAVSINSRMAENDPNLRRPLQRLLSIIRGISTA